MLLFDITTKQYSLPLPRYTGLGIVNLVATVPSLDTFTWLGFRVTWLYGTMFLPGTPASISRIWIETGIAASLVLKNSSMLVTNTPPDFSTKNDCANGSHGTTTELLTWVIVVVVTTVRAIRFSVPLAV
ncbi:hypothetical protein D3C76_937770 [compost metagenome]